MKVILQRVLEANVKVGDQIVGECGRGYLLLIGFSVDDTLDVLKPVAEKIIRLRVFDDENGKMNRSLQDVNGEILAISQFTLYADLRHGRRPSFTQALDYQKAELFYNEFVAELRRYGVKVATGKFGANMKVTLVNDGPVTISLDSDAI